MRPNERFALGGGVLSLLEIDKTIAWNHSVRLTELRITAQVDGWRVMIKGIQRNVPVIAYVYTHYFADALEFATFFANSGTLSFKRDDYPIKFRHIERKP